MAGFSREARGGAQSNDLRLRVKNGPIIKANFSPNGPISRAKNRKIHVFIQTFEIFGEILRKIEPMYRANLTDMVI